MTAPDIAIRTKNLSKSYRRYIHPLDAVIETIIRRPRYTYGMALEGIDLTIQRGEVVGILGRNGAGKSTLLKILSGTLERSIGDMEVNGRVTAILELGSGFHPDYTGRENILMGGLCLGMSRREVQQKMDSIIEFSELGEVIDQPFRTYSTGMQARLTFSTAISVDPDIMIIDEALSVGDARFQLKCFNAMRGLISRRSTILFVSHDINSITALCDRAIILERGRIAFNGPAGEAISRYHHILFGGMEKTSVPAIECGTADPPRKPYHARYGTGQARLVAWGVQDRDGNDLRVISAGSRCVLFMTFSCLEDITTFTSGFVIRDYRGITIWGINSLTAWNGLSSGKRGQLIKVSVDCSMNLAPGEYFVTLGAAHPGGEKIDFIENAFSFKVEGNSKITTDSLVSMDETFSMALTEGGSGFH